MMYVLISDTPVAGTVDRIGQWIERLSDRTAISLIRRNYPHNAFRLSRGSFGCLPDWRSYVANHISRADAIFVHNLYDTELLDLIFNTRSRHGKIFFQNHSPPLEGPAFFYDVLNSYHFDHVFSICQGHARFVQEATPVPNIIPDFHLTEEIKKEKTIFLPHARKTDLRWSNKFSSNDQKYIENHSKMLGDYRMETIQSIFGRDMVTQEEIFLYLKSAATVIDDINTGLFHQTSLEALKAGCAVFSGADLVSHEEFCATTGSPPLPFVTVMGVEEVVRFFASRHRDREIEEVAIKSRDYAVRFLSEERLAKIYWQVVKKFLDS